MASVLEKRNILVQQNIPKLIKNLTGFKVRRSTVSASEKFLIFPLFQTTDENFKTCVQFSFSHFKHHRYLSVNSHEIKRDIDGICEKLRFSNFHDTEKKFKKLVEGCVTSDLAVNHYEKDVIYSILNFLTTLAYDPISNLKTKIRKGEDVITFKPASVKHSKQPSEVFISTLLKDNFKLHRNETDSELSEWTDSDGDDEDSDVEKAEEKKSSLKTCFASSLKPPQKPAVFTAVRIEHPEKWLRDNIQNSWWVNEITSDVIPSAHPVANFCNGWQKHLSDKSLGFIKPRPLSLISEYSLLREIFWMFLNPVDCKFFTFDGEEISLRADVTLASTMPDSLHIFLNDFVRSMNLMSRLKSDCEKSYQQSSLSHTLEAYFKLVQSFLDRIVEFILLEEATVKAQEETYTIVTLHHKIHPHAKMLEMLWRIHSSSVMDEVKFPPHICATFLLASLNHHVHTSCSKETKNLALVLLMTCLRTYLEIFEIWWTEARLDDLKLEFLMEKSERIQPRLLAKSKEKAFYLNEAVSKRILSDPIVTSMLSYSVKGSFTLDIISKLDRVHEMRQIVNESDSLYGQFLRRIDGEIRKFAQNEVEGKKVEVETKPDARNQKLVEDIRNGMLANNDDLLLLAFQSTFDRLTEVKEAKAPRDDQTDLYEILNASTSFILLPLEHSIRRIIDELLEKKISIAEHFLMNIYFHELHVQQHLQDIRRVFFLESSELMNFFYEKLFPQIEAGESAWTNSYLLTVTLNDALCSSRQHSSTLFSVEVKRKSAHPTVLEAIDELTLSFNFNQHLANVFTPKSMEMYNDGEFQL